MYYYLSCHIQMLKTKIKINLYIFKIPQRRRVEEWKIVRVENYRKRFFQKMELSSLL